MTHTVPEPRRVRGAPSWPSQGSACEGQVTVVRAWGWLVWAAVSAACVEAEPVVLVRGVVVSADARAIQPVDVHALGDDGVMVARAPLTAAGEWVLALGVGGPWILEVGAPDARDNAVVRDARQLALALEVCGATDPVVLPPFRALALGCVETPACLEAREVERECGSGARCAAEQTALAQCEASFEARCTPLREAASDCLARQPPVDCAAQLDAAAACRPPDACTVELDAFTKACEVCMRAPQGTSEACSGTCTPVGLTVVAGGTAAELRLGCPGGT